MTREPLHLATARWLLFLTVVGIAYGSVYPFTFEFQPIAIEDALATLLTDMAGEVRPLNLISNLFLFLPYGLFSVYALYSLPAWARYPLLIAFGALLAFSLQILQLWIPGRVPTFADGFINMAGMAAGIVVAQIPWVRSVFLSGGDLDTRKLRTLPLLLMACWIAYRWYPYVPTVDVAAVRAGLRAFLDPQLDMLGLSHHLVAWLVFAVLWRHAGLRQGWLWLVIPVAVLAPVGIADNILHPHHLLAGALAPGVWWLLNRFTYRPMEPVLWLLMLTLVVQGLRPFELGSSSFNWLPFDAFLTGSMAINLVSFLQKIFLYGSLVWLTLETSQNRALALVLPVLVVGLIEAAQTQVAGRVAEITDPLLCVMIWSVAVMGWRPHAAARPLPQRTPESLRRQFT